MRFKIEIEEKYQTHQDNYGQPHYAWRTVTTAYATEVEDGFTIKPTDKVKPGMQVIGNSRMVIGKTYDYIQDGPEILEINV